MRTERMQSKVGRWDHLKGGKHARDVRFTLHARYNDRQVSFVSTKRDARSHFYTRPTRTLAMRLRLWQRVITDTVALKQYLQV
jgi:hypothetical protein